MSRLGVMTVAAWRTGAAVILALAVTLAVAGAASANNWTSRAEKHGYFDDTFGNSSSPYPSTRGPVIDNNDYRSDAIPGSVTTKTGLYDYLRNKYQNPGTYGHAGWDRAGVSFIVNTMIGRDPNQASRQVTDAMWSELRDKLFSGGITLSVSNVSASTYGGVNTYFQYRQNDVAWYRDNSESGRAILLKSGGKTVYVLLYKCANPIGNLAGLPTPPVTPTPNPTPTPSPGPGPTPAPAGRYDLHPVMSLDQFNDAATYRSVASGAVLDFYFSIKNDGPDTSQPTDKWISRCYYPPGIAYPDATKYPGETTNGQIAPLTFGAGAQCTSEALNNQYPKHVFSPGRTTYPPTQEDTSELPAGSHVCFVTSIRPPNLTVSPSTWRHSAPACIGIIKSLTIQARGGDVRAGSVHTAQPQTLSGRTYGSWAEYGIFGIGGISGMASGARLAQGAVTASRPDPLTFANYPTDGSFYPTPPNNNAYAAYAALADETYNVGITRGGPIADNTHKVIVVNGDLTITADMTYDGSYASAADIPRVIYVVSGNITVDAGVTRIDPWLIAKGTVYTCGDYTLPSAQKLTVADCAQPLTFGGPVTAGRIVLGRTFGANGTSSNRDVPSEIFTLGANGFVSGYAAAVSTSNIQTVYEKELPPRY